MAPKGRPLRIAFARISQETNALSPVRTTMGDFRQTHFLEGDALLEACRPDQTEAQGFLKSAELSGFVKAARALGHVDPVPLFSAWAIPSGPLTRACFDELQGRLEEGLRRAGPLDGVFLSLHGAMGVEGLRDPETLLLRSASRAAGGVPVGTTFDLHANLTRERVEAARIICAYRTNPHRDHARTGFQAGALLIRTLRGEIDPVTAWRSLPMLLGGGATLDFWPPMLGIFRRMSALERRGKALTASVCMCHLWNDDPELGWSTLVTTDGERAQAEELADELAERCWATRDVKPVAFAGASHAIAQAHAATLARKLGVVTLSDASDVVSAGATGENTLLLAALLKEGRGLLSYVPLRDPQAVAALWDKPIGSAVTLPVGGRLDPTRNGSLEVSGRVLHRQETGPFGRVVVLDLGDVRLVVTAGHAMAMKPAFYNDLGLDVWKADVVVVKNLFPFRLYFLPYSRKTIYVRTRGITDLDAAFGLPFAGPVHPIDQVPDWRVADRRRRGVA